MLFRSTAEAVVRGALLRVKTDGRAEYRAEGELAIAYWQGDQLDDVRAQLQERFRRRQKLKNGARIEPVAVPLTQRYVHEAASIYNRRVERALVGEKGEALKSLTDDYNRHMGRIQYDETLHLVDQIRRLRKVCCLWYQAKRGALRPVVALPHDVFPVLPDDLAGLDPADPEDYAGYVVETYPESESQSKATGKTYAKVTPEETVFYRGRSPEQMDEVIGAPHPNPYRWEHDVGGFDQRPVKQMRGGQMVTFWHDEKPLALFPNTDATVANFNRDVNVLLSVLNDVMRLQAHNQTVIRLTNRHDPGGTRSQGPLFPIVLGPGEEADVLVSAPSWTEMMDVIVREVKLLAVCLRMSPNDFSLDGVAIESGVAKMMDSIPKMEAREEVLAHTTYLEEEVAWPRERAVLSYLGVLKGDLSKVRKVVRFEGVRYPQSEDDRAKRYETDLKQGFTTRAKLLAEEGGMSLDDAKKTLAEHDAENAEQMKAMQPEPAPGQPGKPGAKPPQRRGFGDLIRQRGGPDA